MFPLRKLQELSHLNVVEHPLESAPACARAEFFYIKERRREIAMAIENNDLEDDVDGTNVPKELAASSTSELGHDEIGDKEIEETLRKKFRTLKEQTERLDALINSNYVDPRRLDSLVKSGARLNDQLFECIAKIDALHLSRESRVKRDIAKMIENTLGSSNEPSRDKQQVQGNGTDVVRPSTSESNAVKAPAVVETTIKNNNNESSVASQ